MTNTPLPVLAAPTTYDIARAQQLFRALSDETRLRILGLLSGGERCVCQLTDTMDAAQSRLSFHLRVLKDAGLLLDRKDGRWVYYRINPEALEEIGGVLEQVRDGFSGWRRSAECCG